MKQVNNLTIKFSKFNAWQVITPKGQVLEEFYLETNALAYAESLHDYMTPTGYYRKYKRRKKVSS